MALDHLVEVEEDFLRRAHRAFAARERRVLFALLCARVVEVAAQRVRDVCVGLLDAREEFLVELVLQRFRRLHHRGGVGVLGFEVGDDFRVLLVAHPEVVVRERDAVDCCSVRNLPRDWRR